MPRSWIRPTTPFQSKFKLCFRESPRGKGFHPRQWSGLPQTTQAPPFQTVQHFRFPQWNDAGQKRRRQHAHGL
ncbi:hypothetical protein FOBRF1_015323 [Fusarium oxysporum]